MLTCVLELPWLTVMLESVCSIFLKYQACAEHLTGIISFILTTQAGTVLSPVIQGRELGHREVKSPARCQSAGRCWSPDFKPRQVIARTKGTGTPTLCGVRLEHHCSQWVLP